MTAIEVIHRKTGQRYTAYQYEVLDIDLTPPTPVTEYSVNGREYTPAEFWREYRQVER
jgi:hypothetical protein